MSARFEAWLEPVDRDFLHAFDRGLGVGATGCPLAGEHRPQQRCAV